MAKTLDGSADISSFHFSFGIAASEAMYSEHVNQAHGKRLSGSKRRLFAGQL